MAVRHARGLWGGFNRWQLRAVLPVTMVVLLLMSGTVFSPVPTRRSPPWPAGHAPAADSGRQ